jgi:Uma2 family endonuclease
MIDIMSAIPRQSALISPEDYLASELNSKVKHEYQGGIVHVKAGARNVHNRIVGNIYLALGRRLRGQKCQPFNSDTKVRVSLHTGQIRFYYPDVQVVCEPNPPEVSFQDHPVVIAEVISRSTRWNDEVEKLQAYKSIPSLQTYLIVESAEKRITAYHKNGLGFDRIVYTADQAVPMHSLNFEIPLQEIYENVGFTAANEDDDGPIE